MTTSTAPPVASKDYQEATKPEDDSNTTHAQQENEDVASSVTAATTATSTSPSTATQTTEAVPSSSSRPRIFHNNNSHNNNHNNTNTSKKPAGHRLQQGMHKLKQGAKGMVHKTLHPHSSSHPPPEQQEQEGEATKETITTNTNAETGAAAKNNTDETTESSPQLPTTTTTTTDDTPVTATMTTTNTLEQKSTTTPTPTTTEHPPITPTTTTMTTTRPHVESSSVRTVDDPLSPPPIVVVSTYSSLLVHVWWISIALAIVPSLHVWQQQQQWRSSSSSISWPAVPESTSMDCTGCTCHPPTSLVRSSTVLDRFLSSMSSLGVTNVLDLWQHDVRGMGHVLVLIWWLWIAYLTGHVASLTRLSQYCSTVWLPLVATTTTTSTQKKSRRRQGGPSSSKPNTASRTVTFDPDGGEQQHKPMTDQRRRRHRWRRRDGTKDEDPVTPRKPIRWIHEKTKTVFKSTIPRRRQQQRQNRGQELQHQDGSQDHHKKEEEPHKLEHQDTEHDDSFDDDDEYYSDDYEDDDDDTVSSGWEWSPWSWHTQFPSSQRDDEPSANNKDNNNHHHPHAPSWLQRLDPTRLSKYPNSNLVQQLLRHKKLRRSPPDLAAAQQAAGTGEPRITAKDGQEAPGTTTTALDEPPTSDTSLGHFGPTTPDQSFHENTHHDTSYTIHPVFCVRGMDIFLNNGTTNTFDVSQEAWFQTNGLRNAPTFIVNCVTQWGNILVYFELPRWVTNFTTAMVEQDTDSDDVRALKRFLTGSNDYRNQRLKIIPSIVDGPMAVKVLAPPKKERIIHGSYVPISWYKHDTEVSSTTGKTLQPVIVCAMDCVSGRAIRSMAGIVKKYFVKLTLDIALVLGPPEIDPKLAHANNRHPPLTTEPPKVDEDDGDLQSCLGLFRFEHIDIEQCPEFPVVELPQEDEEKRDEELACRLSGVSPEELKSLREELEHEDY